VHQYKKEHGRQCFSALDDVYQANGLSQTPADFPPTWDNVAFVIGTKGKIKNVWL
jgi:hypothetical protein